MKHTPTPYRLMTGANGNLLTYNNGAYFKIVSEDAKESMYIYVGGDSDNLGKREFNARNIVHAVNMHELLLATLKQSVESLDEFGCEDIVYYKDIIKKAERK